jgi:EAL domain-containing protein (putative c-di-GMP-specific phosphodiesterase class I)
VSVGLALGRPGRVEAPALIREADAAMYQAKRNGRDRFELFRVEHRPEALDDLEVYAELRGAIDTGAVEVVYQPVVDLRDGSTWGVEALIRWTSPTVGVVDAERIIALAERSNLILELDALVIDRACAFVAACELPTPLRLGVNISTRHLSAGGLPGVVQRALRRSGLAPGALWLELTETEELASADVTDQLRALLDLGVSVAIDDFGKGFSSLSRLRHLPFGLVKLDGAFVVGLEGDYKAQAMLSAVVSLAGALGVTLVVEGVETEGQRATLTRLGCAFAQGYHLVPPLSAEGLRSYLAGDGRHVGACAGV